MDFFNIGLKVLTDWSVGGARTSVDVPTAWIGKSAITQNSKICSMTRAIIRFKIKFL